LSSQSYLKTGTASHSAGALYAADLTGAFLGALTVGIALLPALGTVATCLFMVVVKACSLMLLLCSPGSAGRQRQTPTCCQRAWTRGR
jgi:hypothetical protein